MNEFLRYQRTITIISLAGGAALFLVFLLIIKQPSLAYGLAIGLFAGVFKLRLDVLMIVKFAKMGDQAKPGDAVKNNFQTLIILGAALFLAFYFQNTFNMWAVLGGFLLPRALLIADGILRPQALAEESTAVPENVGDPGEA